MGAMTTRIDATSDPLFMHGPQLTGCQMHAVTGLKDIVDTIDTNGEFAPDADVGRFTAGWTFRRTAARLEI